MEVQIQDIQEGRELGEHLWSAEDFHIVCVQKCVCVDIFLEDTSGGFIRVQRSWNCK